MGSLDDIAANIARWKLDPIAFAKEVFEFEPDKWQEEALRAFGDQDNARLRLSLQACAGPGKTAVLVICGWNFLLCYGGDGEAVKGAAIAVTEANLKDNLWPEFAKWQSKNKYLSTHFKWTKSRIFLIENPENRFISARSFSKTASAEEQGRTLSGLHAENILYLIDESGDIGPSVLRSAEQGLTGCKWGRILQAGNPTSLDGMLYAAATQLRHQWKIIKITGDPEDPMRSPRIDVDWARDQIQIYGRDNPWIMSYILGQFPPSSLNTLLGPDEVEDAMNRHLRKDEYDWAEKRLGIDVARFGDDSTVIFPRQGLAAFRPAMMKNANTIEIASRTAKAKADWLSDQEFFDDTGGWAAGVIDSLNQSGHYPVPINFASKADDTRYLNKRAEMWFRMAEWIKKGGAIPNIPELAQELTSVTYTYHKGKFMLPKKQQIKEQLGRSPDHADALALTFAHVDTPRKQMVMDSMTRGHNYSSDYNPFDTSRL